MTILPKREKETPFDELIIKLLQKELMDLPKRHKKDLRILAFLEVCRIRYLHLLNITDRIQEMGSLVRRGVAVGYPIEEGNTHSVEASLTYFSFIEELNRFGRLLKTKYGRNLPEFYRIRFYRNKIVEHWDEYEKFLQLRNGYTFLPDNLVTPYHSNAIRTSRASQAYSRLKVEFEEKGVSIPLLDVSMRYEDYSDSIFKHLERIDRKLEAFPPRDPLVSMLFKYCFPIPIYDIEGYIKKLISWTEKLLDQ